MEKEMGEIYVNYARTVYKYLLCLTHDKKLSEELTQETFYQASRSIKNFRGDCKIAVWLCQIAKHMWYKELEKKKHKTIPIEIVEKSLVASHNVEVDYFKSAEKIELFSKIHQLDEIVKEVIYLRLTGELTFSEIGEILGKNENWARVTFYRGKQKLLKGKE